MVRLDYALALALGSSGCTVIADVDYRRGDGNEAGDFAFNGTVNFYAEYYDDETADYAQQLDVEGAVELPIQVAFRTNADEWTADLQGGICEYGTVSAVGSGGSPGLGRRLAQIVGGSGTLCIRDLGNGDELSFTPTRVGPPPPGQEGYLPSEIYVQLMMSGQIPDLYDGSEAVPKVPTSTILTSGRFAHYLYEGAELLSTAEGTLTTSIEVID